jgi:hypothetical protein
MKKEFAVAIVLLSVLLVQLGISGLAAEREETISGVYQPLEAEKKAITEDYPAVGQIGLKKTAGDNIDFGDGYILLIREVNLEVGEVLMELQLDDHTIDEKIVRKDEYYEFAKYNEEPKSIRVIEIYPETTGVYVILAKPVIPPTFVPHLYLIISSVPQGADIHIDGLYVGKTQKTIPFVLSSVDFSKMYSLRLVLSGYEEVEQNFQFELDKAEKDILITLNRIQLTPTPTLPKPTPTLVPQTPSPTPPKPTPTLVPQTPSPTPPKPTPTLVPQTPSPTPPKPTPTLVPQTPSPTPPKPTPTLVPQTPSPTPPKPTPTLVPQTSSPTPATPTPAIPTTSLVPPTYSPTPTPPGFLGIAVILAILCGYWISQKRRG